MKFKAQILCNAGTEKGEQLFYDLYIVPNIGDDILINGKLYIVYNRVFSIGENYAVSLWVEDADLTVNKLKHIK